MTTGQNTQPQPASRTRKRQRKAEFIMPPNRLKEKVGSGGIDPAVLEKAEALLQSHDADYRPVGEMYLGLMTEVVADIRENHDFSENAIERLIYPAMQLRASGAMFRFPLVTDIASILVNFLEVLEKLDKDALDVVVAHKMTLTAILHSRINGSGDRQGQELLAALEGACERYFQKYEIDRKTS